MPASATVPESPRRPESPICLAPNANCLLLNCVRTMGQGILYKLMTFIQAGEDGSRLTLQKNRQGFTLQVTGAVQEGHTSGHDDVTDLRALQERLQRLYARGSSMQRNSAIGFRELPDPEEGGCNAEKALHHYVEPVGHTSKRRRRCRYSGTHPGPRG